MSGETTTIRIRGVIGTGDPTDILFCIPLIASHGYPSNCCFGELLDDAKCEKAVQRLLVLEEPFQGHELLSACEPHFQRFDRTDREPAAAAPDYVMDARD